MQALKLYRQTIHADESGTFAAVMRCGFFYSVGQSAPEAVGGHVIP